MTAQEAGRAATQTIKRITRTEGVPHHKWSAIFARTLTGVALFALGVFGGWKLGWNQWLTIGTCAVGGHMVSGQFLTGSIKTILGLAKDAVKVVSKDAPSE